MIGGVSCTVIVCISNGQVAAPEGTAMGTEEAAKPW